MNKTDRGFFQHPDAIVETVRVGRGTRIRAFAHLLPGATIGEDCDIRDMVFVQGDVVIGNRVTLARGVQLRDGVTLEDDVVVGPNVSCTRVLDSGVPQSPRPLVRTLVRRGAAIGANAILLPGVTVGQEAVIAAGAVVADDVPPRGIVTGNPARVRGYVEARKQHPVSSILPERSDPPPDLCIASARLHRLPLVKDPRGMLSFGEIGAHLPFVPMRYFIVSGVPAKQVRGGHAHRALHQFLVCVRGSCRVMLDDGRSPAEVVLDAPNLGLHMPPLVWSLLYEHTADAVLLVLASEKYAPDDYISSYAEFLELLEPR